MLFERPNVNKFLVEEQRRHTALADDFSLLIGDIVRSCKVVSQYLSRGHLAGLQGVAFTPGSPGEAQKNPSELFNQTFIQHCAWGGHLAAMSSCCMDDIYRVASHSQRGKYLLIFDPLDGASNIDVNNMVGSVFSVFRCPDNSQEPSATDFLQPGTSQLAAGYALYGPSTMLVLTVGSGTHGFTLDREIGEFLLTHQNIQIPVETSNFAINASNERFWEPPIRRYVDECLEGQTGIRGRDFNMRWAATMVADIHRLLMRGGVFLYPCDSKDLSDPGRLTLLHKVNPMAMIIEQAGGMASTGYKRIADVIPENLHGHVPAILGSRDEIERINRYHTEYASGEDKPFSSPLFATRTLFRN